MNQPTSEDFEQWMTEHMEVCEQCYTSIEVNPDVGLCVIAFEKLREYMVKLLGDEEDT